MPINIIKGGSSVNLSLIESQLADINQQNLITDIQSKQYKVGDKIFSKLYGGSYWEVKASVSMGYNSPVNFTDELHIVVNLVGGGTGIAECQWTSVMNYAKSINTSKYTETFARLKRRQSVVIACKSDSIFYGQNNEDVNSIDRTGQATNFGDGSVYDSNKQDSNPVPNVLESTLRTAYNNNNIIVKNCGYPGDWVGGSYCRHRVNQGSTLTIVELGVNDMLMNTGAGIAPNKVIDDSDPFSLSNFIFYYRKYIIREMLRGNAVILMSSFKWVGTQGYVGAELIQLYNNAIKQLGEEFNIPVIDLEDFVGGYVASTVLSGVHLTHIGNDIVGKRLASLFIGNGYRYADRISGDRHISGVSFGENLLISLDDTVNYIGNTNSFQYAVTSPTESLDYILSSGKNIYYSFYLENDKQIIMPLVNIPANTGLNYSLDFGITQPEYKIDIEASDVVNQRGELINNVTITAGGTNLLINSLDDIPSHLVIRGKGWHTLKITCSSGSYVVFEGIRVCPYEYVKNSMWRNLTLLNGIYSITNNLAQYKIEDGCIKFRGIIENDNFNAYVKILDLPLPSKIPTSYNNKILTTATGSILQITDNAGVKELWWNAQTNTVLCNIAELVIYLTV